MHIVYNFIFLFAAWRWGDWRNWEKYYPTILFFVFGDLLHNFIMYNHYYWLLHENLLPTVLPNHTIISLMTMVISYPATILIYLKYFFQTKKWWLRALHLVIWVTLYLGGEFVNLRLGLISHHNGWHMGWSILFVIVMFIMFPIHHKKPLLALGISLLFIVFLLFQFNIPLEKMK
ncbi:CBO0543 family protein [Sutcliffiella halmapala]|uniref:CBO0543 family protein n=1 Tax=Sutcliffiella halmapala TaxID=79882 RepID=UPI000995D1F3|nr:CBO0543 family protein [Sutcliffiella halmapala]